MKNKMYLPRFTAEVPLKLFSTFKKDTEKNFESFPITGIIPQLKILPRFPSPGNILTKSPGNSGIISCEGLQCTCTSEADCTLMLITPGLCGDIVSCDNGGCKCLRI